MIRLYSLHYAQISIIRRKVHPREHSERALGFKGMQAFTTPLRGKPKAAAFLRLPDVSSNSRLSANLQTAQLWWFS